jgi:hypothetical protein
MRFREVAFATLAGLFIGCSTSSNEKPTGSEGGPCFANGSCNPGLACLSNLCVRTNDGATPDTSHSDASPPDSAGPDSKPVCSSLSFDGIGSYVGVPNSAGLNPGKGDFTVEAWVKAMNNDAVLVSKRKGENYYYIEMNDLNKNSPVHLWFVTTAGWLVFSADKQGKADAWTHVAAQRHGSAVEMFIDGKQQQVITIPNKGSTDPADYDVTNDAPLYIGRQPDGQYLNGEISELRITNSVVYSSDFTPQETLSKLADTVALYHFDEGTGTKLTDSSGNGNDGTINGATWSTGGPGCP